VDWLDEGGAPELTCFDEFLERADVLWTVERANDSDRKFFAD